MDLLYLLREVDMVHLRKFQDQLETMLRLSSALIRERLSLDRRNARWAAADAVAETNGRPCEPVH
jgi:hypothetical protein